MSAALAARRRPRNQLLALGLLGFLGWRLVDALRWLPSQAATHGLDAALRWPPERRLAQALENVPSGSPAFAAETQAVLQMLAQHCAPHDVVVLLDASAQARDLGFVLSAVAFPRIVLRCAAAGELPAFVQRVRAASDAPVFVLAETERALGPAFATPPLARSAGHVLHQLAGKAP